MNDERGIPNWAQYLIGAAISIVMAGAYLAWTDRGTAETPAVSPGNVPAGAEPAPPGDQPVAPAPLADPAPPDEDPDAHGAAPVTPAGSGS